MSQIKHPETGFIIGDPTKPQITSENFPSQKIIKETFSKMILSASGWRTIYAKNDNEDSLDESVDIVHLVITSLIAKVFAEYMIQNNNQKKPSIALGIDSRPTGPALADIITKVFSFYEIQTRYMFIVAAPEIMAYVKVQSDFSKNNLSAINPDNLDGFCYISASHNPPGHNGFKFGLNDGGVLSKEEITPLIEKLTLEIDNPNLKENVLNMINNYDIKKVSEIYSYVTHEKRKSRSAYLLFTREVSSGSKALDEQEFYFDMIQSEIKKRPLAILAELNGSARGLSIDADFLSSIGIEVLVENGRPRNFMHRIVPEGSSLDLCTKLLDSLHNENPAFCFGYVPDCDGDRGNIVIWDDLHKRARALEAQETFALCVLAELCSLEAQGAFKRDAKGKPTQRIVIVVNDPTSMRIDSIASCFQAEVARAEVGEANIVNLARDLRKEGAIVRIAGEGSNGGNITWPASVRDPINTLFALIKLLYSPINGKPIAQIWATLSGKPNENVSTLSDILAIMPEYTTTSVFEDRAGISIKNKNHSILKKSFEKIFIQEWEEKKQYLARNFGIVSWEAISYSGKIETKNITDFSTSKNGGLKILLKDKNNSPYAFLWMRGSGTEAIFRVLVDTKGYNTETENYFLDWLKSMLLKADNVI